jgi:hypothetical protein
LVQGLGRVRHVGWTSFEVLDLVLAGLAVAALLAAAERLGYATPVGARGLTGIGIAAFAIVVSQLLNHPPAATGRSAQVGAWLALGSSILIGAGGIVGAAKISVELVVDRNGEGAGAPSTSRAVESEAAAEAAAEEPKVERELYPQDRGAGPIGADDPEPFRAGSDDGEEETKRIE